MKIFKDFTKKELIGHAISIAGVVVTIVFIAKPDNVINNLYENKYFVPVNGLVSDIRQAIVPDTDQKTAEVIPSYVPDVKMEQEEVKPDVTVTKEQPKTIAAKAVQEVSNSTSTDVKLVNVNGVTVDERYADVVRQQMLDAMVQKQQAEDLVRTQQEAIKREAEEKAFQVWYDTKYLELKKYAEYLTSTGVQEYIEEANKKFYSKPTPTIDNYKTW